MKVKCVGGKVGVVNPQVALGPRLLAPWVPRQLPEGRLCLLRGGGEEVCVLVAVSKALDYGEIF